MNYPIIPKNCKLVIFDLDNTLQFDRYHGPLEPTVREILVYLKMNGVKLALASLSRSAEKRLKQYNLRSYFDYVHRRLDFWECATKLEYKLSMTYRKDYMFKSILRESGIEPENTLFFDDSPFHVYEARKMSIKALKIGTLINWNHLRKSFRQFNKRRAGSCRA